MVRLYPLALLSCIGGSNANPDTIRQELLKNVDDIRQAQIDLLVVGEFTPCGEESSATEATGSSARTWASTKCWADIGWAPEGDVYGGYWVTVSDGAFTAHGIGPDLGGGPRIHVIATPQKAAHVLP